jgi:microcompartment protein PduM
MALTSQRIQDLVDQIVRLLQQREQATYCVQQSDLAKGLPVPVFLHHAHLHIELPDLGFIHHLAQLDTSDHAVQTVLDAWSYGVDVRITLHPHLLRALPVQALSHLPITLQEPGGRPVYLCAQPVVSYQDVVQLEPALLVLAPRTLLTPLARDVMQQHTISWIRPE